VSLILGVLALLGAAIPFVNWISVVFALVGLVLGIIALVRYQQRGLALAGTIVSGVALLISISAVIAYTAWAGSFIALIDSASTPFLDQSETAAPLPDPETEPAPSGDPVPLGDPVPIGEAFVVETSGGQPLWEVTIDAVRSDATSELVAAGSPEPDPGFEYVAVLMTATNVQDTAWDPWTEIYLEFTTPDGEVFDEFSNAAIVPDPAFRDIGSIEPGANGTGSFVIMVPVGALDSGLLLVSSGLDDQGTAVSPR